MPHSVHVCRMLIKRGCGVKNALIDPVTLTFDLSFPKSYHFQDIPRSFPIPSLNTLGLFDYVTTDIKAAIDPARNREVCFNLVVRITLLEERKRRNNMLSNSIALLWSPDLAIARASYHHILPLFFFIFSPATLSQTSENRHPETFPHDVA